MTRYWWVNHKQTFHQEIEGEYLWSPKVKSGGQRNYFYDTMRMADPDDLVLSFAYAKISYVGRVADFALTAPKPDEFGTAGEYWRREGWRLPVAWTPLDTPVYPKTLISRLQTMLPVRYSPLNLETGNGNQGAYLAEISEDVFCTILAATKFDRHALAHIGTNRLNHDAIVEELEDEVEQRIVIDTSLDSTTRESILKARRGQGQFRKSVETREPACRLTGICNQALLIASHIKPWRLCASAQERLDGWNGLMLTPDADHLFDRGFITFEHDGAVKVSPRVDDSDLRRLGFETLVRQRSGLAEAPSIWRTAEFHSQQEAYLDYHRKAVFIA